MTQSPSLPPDDATPQAPPHPDTSRPRSHPIRRVARLTAGGILLPVGIVLGISPIPVGFILIPLSLYLLAGESQTVRSAICRGRRRLPPLDRALRAVAHRLPQKVMHMIHDTDPQKGCSCGRAEKPQTDVV